MLYTQKDMRELLGFTRDQLRLYERRGIIHPEVDPANGYRHYDDWQVNLLWDCRYYQGMGFSLAQIEEILQQDGLEDLEGRLDTHEHELERKLRYQELVLGECHQNLRMMRETGELLGSYRVTRHEGCAFVPMRREHEISCEPMSKTVRLFASHAGITAPYFWFPSAAEDTYYWGFAMRDEVRQGLVAIDGNDAAKALEGATRIEAGEALVTCVDAGGRWGFGRELFQGLLDEAKRLGLEPVGNLHGILVARTHDEEGFHRYVRAYLPVVSQPQTHPLP